jgi:hypothetical protein
MGSLSAKNASEKFSRLGTFKVNLKAKIYIYVNPFAPAAKSLSDWPGNLHLGWKKIKNKNTFWRRFFFATRLFVTNTLL